MQQTIKSKKPGWLGYGIVIALLHIIGFLGMLVVSRDHPLFWGLGFLAYTLGMRHAFDADHIAAIDNTVRKLVQLKQKPEGVGFYFSLGHSTVVFLLAVLLAISVSWVQSELPQLREIGEIVGMTVSGSFLMIIGFVNLLILFDLLKLFTRMRKEKTDDQEVERLLHARGLIARFAGPLMRFVTRSWHVYPLGFLFGLGFDTASEVALLSISAGAAQNAIPFIGILSLPVLFAAGMSLLDTADGVFMTTAYRWAFHTPLRKLYYNLTVTGISVLAALIIGTVELAQVLASKLGWSGGFWNWVQELDFGEIGYALVILFAAAWLISYGAWKIFNIEKRWEEQG
ncbi:HoxN/HupN/NixA family nickel/cobalt transporter [Brevibacillus sp. B_LB10_24]|uniref:HoxN/HupN/NixA family nickel/cobalt transporter n=1 Tax=Brevibacillus sp. B_LB10_24 TaxID=3380645 RepID=UPI0038B954C4